MSHVSSDHASAGTTDAYHSSIWHSFAASSPDRAITSRRNKEYPKEVWYFVACFIFLVSLFHHGSWIVSKLSKRRARKVDAEGGTDPSKGHFSVRHIPRAIVNAYRVMAFRWTFELGSSYTLNMAEVFVSCAYIIALFVWTFINSTSIRLLIFMTSATDHAHALATSVSGQKYTLRYWGNRSGNIASAQLPLVTALGTKNNVVSRESH